jgi:hypothetical protein
MRYCLYLPSFFVLLSLGSIDVVAQSFGFQLPEGKSSITLPFELKNQLIILPVKVNGAGPFNFILDSGSRNTFLLQPKLKDSLQLQPSGQLFVLGAGLKDTVVADIIRQVTLESGSLVGKFQSILVLNRELPEISEMLGVEIHGILGADLFNRFAIHVHYKKRKLTLLSPDELTPPTAYTEIPVEVVNNKAYIYAIVKNEWLQPQLVKLMIDCGASLAFLFNYNANEDQSYPYFSRYIESDVGIGLSGMIPGYIGRLYQAQIAHFNFEGIIISTVPYSETTNDYYLNERDGLMGSEILSRFHIWYNLPKGKIFIRPNNRLSSPFQYDMSGILFSAQRDTLHFPIVRQVIEDSPAAQSGILPGDIITAIQGKSTDEISHADLISILKSKEGRRITLNIKRGNGTHKVSIRLKALL